MMLSTGIRLWVGLSLMIFWNDVGICLELVVSVLSVRLVMLRVMVIVDLLFDLLDMYCGRWVLWIVL